MLSPAELTRYARQLQLPDWSPQAQERLKAARVFVAGAGGLASALAVYLLAAGVGRVRIVDSQRVSLDKLHDQLFYRERDLDRFKAAIAEQRLREINPFSEVEALPRKITEYNVLRLTEGYNLLLDTLNNFWAQKLLNRAAIKHRLPLVHAAVKGLSGHLTTLWPGQGPCLICAFPDPPPINPSGLLGPLPGILGSLQAMEALRILGGLGPALLGRMLRFDGQHLSFTEQQLEVNPNCPACKGGLLFR
ncbi:MAG: HesA/MoeB/ThiF family protein [Deltaproteobacteria bacterium]|nr:HesA/MoeB/ThiF family protein [Deltaproteobacteria bacterium]MBW1953159.1 HesA/MoeB/ThiF family protein [Deltaproteobacteria bacterium]MBW1986427.1 HesA/MoeB/ThiF family protein [Deltaproteobacteria bacterium]MBW2133821.1 HesA/MoeB/ThiF family protein [Deltaproteobacteria bacterium]